MLNQISSWLGGIPTAAVIALLVVVVVQVALQVAALIDLAKRHSVMFDRKWIWILIVVAGNLLGAIAYWAFARTEVPEDTSSAPPGDTERSKRALDQLYGSEDEE